MPITIPLSDAEIAAVSAAIKDVAHTVILPMFDHHAPIESSDKSGHGDWVTEGDVQAERALTAFLMQLRPESTILGEEVVGTDLDLYHKLRHKPGMVWTVDPIDGTANFREKNPGFGTMIACVYDGQIQHAWIYCPRMEGGIMLAASKGRGAFAHYDDGKPGHILEVGAMTDACKFVGSYPLTRTWGFDHDTYAWLLRTTEQHGLQNYEQKSIGADTVDMVLRRQKTSIFAHVKLWDSAPTSLILNESGGIAGPINHFAQNIYGYNGEDLFVFASNQASALMVRALLGQKRGA